MPLRSNVVGWGHTEIALLVSFLDAVALHRYDDHILIQVPRELGSPNKKVPIDDVRILSNKMANAVGKVIRCLEHHGEELAVHPDDFQTMLTEVAHISRRINAKRP